MTTPSKAAMRAVRAIDSIERSNIGAMTDEERAAIIDNEFANQRPGIESATAERIAKWLEAKVGKLNIDAGAALACASDAIRNGEWKEPINDDAAPDELSAR